MSPVPLRLLTDFADQAVILPVAAAVALALLAQGWWRGLAAWCAGVGATLATMLVLKLVFAACPSWAFLHSPSGHTAAAAVVAGGLLGLLAAGRVGARGAAVMAFAVAVPIGASRVWLGAHSVAEVLAGGAVGMLGALALARLAGPAPAGTRLWLVAAAALVAALAAYGGHLNAEAAIDRAAPGILGYFGFCGR